jgi:3-dehydroquinate synthase
VEAEGSCLLGWGIVFDEIFMITNRIDVDLGSRSYSVLIGGGLLGGVGEIFREEGLKQTNAFVVTNGEVGGRYFGKLEKSLMGSGFSRVVRHDIPSTEEGKNWEEFSGVCAALLRQFPDTGSVPLVILLGGGVVGDLGGFAAGVFRRGIPFVQMPTTLLAAVDSSVGGKVAVNFGGVKNIMGIFNQPRLVVADLDLLQSLPEREIRSGTSEIIKYGAVCSSGLFQRLEEGGLERLLRLDGEMVTEIVADCVRLKARVVERDEFDKKGIRNVLNFGHTIGHALELSVDYALTHGEAIAIGMMAAMHLGESLNRCPRGFSVRLCELITRAGLPIQFGNRDGLSERIIRAMQMDKKFRDGKNVFVLATSVGEWEQAENVSWDLVQSAVDSVLI